MVSINYIIRLVSERLINLNPYRPLELLDFLTALFLMISFLVYLRRFPVFRVVVGTFFLLVCALLFFMGNFILTSVVFGFAGGLILISLPLIFAPEIRHYLEKLGRFPFLKILSISENGKNGLFIRNLTDAVFELAERKIGAILVIQRKTGLGATIETGAITDARFGSKLLQTIFFPKSPLHDGAVIIKDGRIISAGCLLPIDSRIKLDPPFGTRHRAGLAITRDTDAVSIIVSEQRGEVSLAENSKLKVNLDRVQLQEALTQLI